MNPLPAPIIPGKTEAERFNNALRKIMTTPPAKTSEQKSVRESPWSSSPRARRKTK